MTTPQEHAQRAEAMRRAARELRDRAAAVDQLGGSLGRLPDGKTFQGPAGNRFRDDMHRHKSEATAVAADLRGAASRLEQSANAEAHIAR